MWVSAGAATDISIKIIYLTRVKLVGVISDSYFFFKRVSNRIVNISPENKDIGVASVQKLVRFRLSLRFYWLKNSENSEFGIRFSRKIQMFKTLFFHNALRKFMENAYIHQINF